MQLQDNLTNDREKRYNSIHRQKSLLNALRRPIEIAANSRHCIRESLSLQAHTTDQLVGGVVVAFSTADTYSSNPKLVRNGAILSQHCFMPGFMSIPKRDC